MAFHKALVHLGDAAHEPVGIKRQSQVHMAALVDADVEFDDVEPDVLILARDDVGRAPRPPAFH